MALALKMRWPKVQRRLLGPVPHVFNQRSVVRLASRCARDARTRVQDPPG